MPNRILFLVSAVLASLALPVIPNAARAADDCLTSPDQATPSGGHWRYHLERGTGRKCWYLADEAAKTGPAKADAAKPDTDDGDVTESAPPRPAAKISPSLERAAASPPDRPRTATPATSPAAPVPATNARAEYIDPPQPAPSAPAQPDAPQATAPGSRAQQGTVGTRWPSPVSTGPGNIGAAESNSAPATSMVPAASANAEPQPAVASTDQATPASTPATDQTSAEPLPAGSTNGPDYLLYALVAAVTAFAAVVGFSGLRFLFDWWRDWREESRWRRSEQSYAAYRERSMLAMGEVSMELTPADDAAASRPRPRQFVETEEPVRRLEDEIDEIEQLLALTRQASPPSRVSSWEAPAPHDAAE